MKELSLHLLDLIENAVAAGARRVAITLVEDETNDRLRLAVKDDGRGMAPELARSAQDPFTTTRSTRNVGMGLALLAAAAEQAGGRFSLRSEPGRGTEVTAEFQLSHIDRAPLGRLEDTLAAAALVHPQTEIRLLHRVGRRHYRVVRAVEESSAAEPAVARQLARRIAAGRRRIGSTA